MSESVYESMSRRLLAYAAARESAKKSLNNLAEDLSSVDKVVADIDNMLDKMLDMPEMMPLMDKAHRAWVGLRNDLGFKAKSIAEADSKSPTDRLLWLMEGVNLHLALVNIEEDRLHKIKYKDLGDAVAVYIDE